jgi:pimeloyl-ACP methyl ester carboxylesterase
MGSNLGAKRSVDLSRGAARSARILVVHGDRDRLYPVMLALEMHVAMPASHLWVIPNGGPGPIFGDVAPVFARTALAFLNGEWHSPWGAGESRMVIGRAAEPSVAADAG